jgi:hypothetical protein
MEFYLPSLFIIILAAIVTFVLIPKLTPLILAVFATVCLLIALYNHSSLFSNEYKNMNWASTATSSMASPYLLVGLVIVLSVGYLILLFTTGKAPTLSMPSNTIPPPSTATNVVTRGIGNGLVNIGFAKAAPANAGPTNVSPINVPRNTAGRNALESALSKRV